MKARWLLGCGGICGQRGQSTRQRRLFYLEGDPKTLSSKARSTAQAPAPGREHGHFVRVRINASKNHNHLRNRGPSIVYAMHLRLLPKPQPPPKPGGQALRTQCKKRAGSGTTDHPETAARGILPLRNHCPLRNQGANHFGGSKHYFTSIAHAMQRRAGSGTTDHPETTDRAAARAPDTRQKRRSLRDSGTLRHGGGAVAATAQRLQLRNHASFTPFLPRFYPTFAPCRVKCHISTPFLPPFYPVAPISFYPQG